MAAQILGHPDLRSIVDGLLELQMFIHQSYAKAFSSLQEQWNLARTIVMPKAWDYKQGYDWVFNVVICGGKATGDGASQVAEVIALGQSVESNAQGTLRC